MPVRFANRMGSLKASDIRELLKLTARPSVISFAGGLPAPELFPVADLAKAAAKTLAEEGQKALQYSTTEGHPPLRKWIAERMNSLGGSRFGADEILITSGSQQGLDLVGKLLLDEGDEILCESPTYLGAVSAWNVFQARWVEVPTDDDGMDLAALEKRLDGCRNPKVIYVVPNFQNPSGRTWSVERRRGLVEIASRRDIPIVEDNPYGELRFEGESLPMVASFDTRGLVVVLGTFSKTLCPGMRMAWVAAEPGILGKLVILKQGADLHSATFDQMVLSTYLESCDIDANVRKLIAAYRSRREAMVAALKREMPEGVTFSHPQGGLFLWLTLPPSINARELLVRCLERDVAFVPGDSFFPNGGKHNNARLNFSCMPEAKIEEGVRRLGQALRDMMAQSEAAKKSGGALAFP